MKYEKGTIESFDTVIDVLYDRIGNVIEKRNSVSRKDIAYAAMTRNIDRMIDTITLIKAIRENITET